MPIKAVQQFMLGTVTNNEKQAMETLSAIKAAGYDGIELCGFIIRPTPLIVQLLLVELIIDILKIASLNTPDVLSNSFSMLGALILGDFAVQARWLVPEVLVYMAFVAVANYAQHSYEMGYATKLCRMLLLVLIWARLW